MERGKEYHLEQLRGIISPDQRSIYYKKNVDSTVVDLSTAENILLLEFYQKYIFVDLGQINQETIRYPTYPYGNPDYMNSLRSFLHTQWNVSVDPADIFATSGVVAGLELAAFALFKPEDEVLIPAPMWYGFPWSFTQSAGMKLVPFEIDSGTNLTKADVERALRKTPNAKLLVLTNPNNPLGVNYPKQLQEEIYSIFLENTDGHIISDEIYACSQVKNKDEFVSALSLNAYQKYVNRIHVTWGLSKDFGLAGFRAGFIISKSPIVQRALKGDSCKASSVWFSPFVTLNPYMTRRLFFNEAGRPDPQLANSAMLLYKNLLEKQFNETAQHLRRNNIEYYPGNDGAIFFWIDLRDYLNRVPATVSDQPELCQELYNYDDPRERRLLNYIRDHANVLLVRGQECFNQEAGFFRLCYTAEELDRLTLGIDRMANILEDLPPAA